MMKTRHGNVDANGNLVEAPSTLVIDGARILGPTDEQYRSQNWLPVDDGYYPAEPPAAGRHWEATGKWETAGGLIRRVFEAVDDPAPELADYDFAMEAHLRNEREARGYTTREPDVYLNSKVARWASDAADWVAHRDEVMLYALGVMNAVVSGEREPPTIAEFTANLPAIRWTAQAEG